MKLLGTKSEQLPPPLLTLETSGIIHGGKSVDLLCIAPVNYTGAVFYLLVKNKREALQSLRSPETSHSVTFQEVASSDSKGYMCLYQIRVSEGLQASQPSKALYLSVTGNQPLSAGQTQAERLPQPQLTLETLGLIQNGQSIDLVCTAPSNYQGAIFYLNIQSNNALLQRQQASEDRNSVTFTLQEVTSSDSRGYICFYQILVSGILQESEPSNELYLTVTEHLPSPQLTLETPGVIRSAQSTNLLCTAPSNYLGATFYLNTESYDMHLQTLEAPGDRHSVTFTLQEVTASKSRGYVCLYQIMISGTLYLSTPSNVLHFTVTDDRVLSASPTGPSKAEEVPSWIIPVVAGVTGLILLVLSVFVSVRMVKRFKEKKKKEKRERESVWTQQNMASDWSYNNTAYSMNPQSQIGFPSSSPCSSMILEEGKIDRHFSTFRA
ncbi:protein HIDE1 isoform 2-T2 [Discoglossus pictus]